jgi:hypothetical protein
VLFHAALPLLQTIQSTESACRLVNNTEAVLLVLISITLANVRAVEERFRLLMVNLKLARDAKEDSKVVMMNPSELKEGIGVVGLVN